MKAHPGFILIPVFLLLFGFTVRANAAPRYFDYEPEQRIVSSEGELRLELKFIMEPQYIKRFRMRPLTEGQPVSIWDPVSEKWISGSNLWTDMPRLAEEVRVRFPNAKSGKFLLWFEFQDTLKGRIFSSSQKNIWSYGIYSGYDEKINDSIRSWQGNGKIP